MATKLEIYNDALRLVGDLRLVSTSDDVEARYALDNAWSRAVLFCAAQANWPHAYNSTSVNLSADASSPGYNKSYTIDSSDWLRTVAVSLDQHFSVGAHFHEALGKLFLNTSASTAYVRYIDRTYLGDTYISTWSEMFCSVVAHRLAFEVCERLTQDPQKAQGIYQLFAEVLNLAKSQHALEKGGMMISPAQWAAKVHNDTIAAIWDEAIRLMGTGDPKMALVQRPVDAKPVHEVMEMAWRGVVLYCLNEAYWNFATKTSLLSSSAGAGTGYTHSFSKPADWLRTVDVAGGSDPDFKTSIDYRDEGGRWYVNSSSIYVRYVSTDYSQDSDATGWPDSFKRLLACRLAYECVDLVTGIPDKRGILEKEYATQVARSISIDASGSSLTIPKRRNSTVGSIWSESLRLMGYVEGSKGTADKDDEADRVYRVLDAAWSRVVKFCLTEHYWNFATTTVSILSSGASSLGYSYGFEKPSDWLRTIGVASDAAFSSSTEYRDQGGRFFANVTPIYVRYISSNSSLDASATSWPEPFVRAVAYRLAYECSDVVTGDPARRAALLEEYKSALESAARKDAADQSLIIPKRRNSTITAIWKEASRLMGYPETRKAAPETEIGIESVYQIFDDAWQRVVRFCLTEGLWNFATKTSQITQSGVPIPGWQYAFNKPSGWLRTIAVSNSSEFFAEARYHDEGGKLYSNDSTLYIRFMSSDYGADAEAPNWPEMFCRVLAYRLAYECSDAVTGDPNRSTKLMADYKSMLAQAKGKDAMDQAQMFPRTSNWLGAMRGASNRRYDRGSLSGF